MRAVATIICLLFISGCGGLIINREDSAGAKIAKFTTRTVLGVGTLGMSELGVANAKAERDLQAYIASLPPDERRQFISQLILDRERQRAAAMQRMGQAISQGTKDLKFGETTCTPGILGCTNYPGGRH